MTNMKRDGAGNSSRQAGILDIKLGNNGWKVNCQDVGPMNKRL